MRAKTVKKKLNDSIKHIAENKEQYCENPNAFTRNRKLPFDRVLKTVLSFEGKSLNNEFIDLFGFSNRFTSSAFVQQRSKINSAAFYDLFREFTSKTVKNSLFKGYRLIAVDGSDIHIPTNKEHEESYFEGKDNQKPYNLLHLNALYDICSKVYVDALVQSRLCWNEHSALIEMLKRNQLDSNTIIIADRGYEAYNNFANIHELGLKYLFRVKDVQSKGVATALNLPDSCFDEQIDLNLTRKQSNATKALFKNKRNYKFLPANTNFDFLPEKSKYLEDSIFYNLKFRIVRFKISDDSYETIITNLDLPIEDIKALYAMRWGIETSFRKLKFTVGLLHFHSKKAELILQEIFANLIIYNFTELIASIPIRKGNKKYDYQANFSVAVNICRKLFLNRISPHRCETEIASNISPIRPNRKFERIISSKTSFSFSYRVS